MLAELPAEQWEGGKVHFIRENVIHLMRGQMYRIQGKDFFVFGGARSHDIEDGIMEREGLDLCQYFGQKKSKDYAAFFSSSSSFCCGVK